MAEEMGRNLKQEFSCLISIMKMLSLSSWGLWCCSTTQVNCSKVEVVWSCPGAAVHAVAWLIVCTPILSCAVTWGFLLHQHISTSNVPRRESLNEYPCAHSAKSASKKKGLVQGRNKQLGNGAGTRNISLSSDAGLCPCEADLKLETNVLFFSREFDRLRLFSLFSARWAQTACVIGEFLLHWNCRLQLL